MPRRAEGPSDETLAALIAEPLTPFEGQIVVGCAIEVPNAGGGLHEALAFEPIELHHGQEGYLLVHYVVKKVRFDPVKDTESLRRVHVLGVTETAMVNEDYADDVFTEQRDRIQRLREKAQGVQRLDDPENGLKPDADGFVDPGPGGYPASDG